MLEARAEGPVIRAPEVNLVKISCGDAQLAPLFAQNRGMCRKYEFCGLWLAVLCAAKFCNPLTTGPKLRVLVLLCFFTCLLAIQYFALHPTVIVQQTKQNDEIKVTRSSDKI